MANYLVIVESPAKVNTVKKYLGSSYNVAASMGHVRDLPKSTLGIDVEKDFEPRYITIRGKGELISALKKEAKEADKVFLATDPDREGEAISWHLAAALDLDPEKMRRITFNEITKNAVKASLKEARDIDMDLVNEQQARRCLDRMVGYEISPLLWKKVKRGLSAGRVQSVALRIIADRDEEIESFVPEEYWTLDAVFPSGKAKKPLKAHFYGRNGRKIALTTGSQVEKIKEEIGDAEFSISDMKFSDKIKKSPWPFTTSTLQQEASRALNFSTSKTMRIAQQLYEGVNVKGQGQVGLITYLRTDSVRVSAEADTMAKTYILNNFGKSYVSGSIAAKKNSESVQDAHEAIRPTDVERTPASVKDSLSRDQYRLYQLIWKRFLASRMTNARYDTAAVTMDAAGYQFRAASSKLAFDGYMAVYSGEEEREEDSPILFDLKQGESLKADKLEREQHFTQPPAHYTEATLVRAMEELGIGRPSTYAPTITTILQRNYISKDGRNLFATELGKAVNGLMKDAFSDIVDVHFTANMEKRLDDVGAGKTDWKEVLREFWPELTSNVKKAEEEIGRVKVKDEETDEICELCGRKMVIKFGPHGRFLACPGFPECRNTKPLLEKTGAICPDCGGEIVVRHTKKGRRFYSCANYPECKYMTWQKPRAKKQQSS